MPKTIIVDAKIECVLDNPYRDFINYPIDEIQIERLKASFEAFSEDNESGLWHAMPARPAKDPNKYEICFGHHRKVAAQRLGYKTIRLEVGTHDDDEMILMLAVENGTQRVNNSAASLDSVAAITRRLAYLLLRADSLDNLATIIARSEAERLFESQRAFEVSRGTLMKGDGIGERLVLKYAPTGSLNLPEVRSSIATLKADGGYQRIIEMVTEQVRQERAVAEAERLRIDALIREAEERRLQQEREEAERQEREAERREAEERKREEDARRRAEEAEWQRQAYLRNRQDRQEREERRKRDKANQDEQDAAAALARLAIEREQREREQAAKDNERRAYNEMQERLREERRQKALKKDAELLALAMREATEDRLLDSRVVPYFRNHHCLSRFREMVTDENNRHWFPIGEQLAHVEAICTLFEKDNAGKSAAENLTANYVASYLRGYLEKNQRAAREDEARARTLGQSFDAQLTKAVKGASWIFGAVAEMINLLDKGASPPIDFEEKLRSLEMQATDQIARLRASSGYVRNVKEIAGEAIVIRHPAVSR